MALLLGPLFEPNKRAFWVSARINIIYHILVYLLVGLYLRNWWVVLLGISLNILLALLLARGAGHGYGDTIAAIAFLVQIFLNFVVPLSAMGNLLAEDLGISDLELGITLSMFGADIPVLILSTKRGRNITEKEWLTRLKIILPPYLQKEGALRMDFRSLNVHYRNLVIQWAKKKLIDPNIEVDEQWQPDPRDDVYDRLHDRVNKTTLKYVPNP